MLTDRQTGMTKIIVAFRNFANATRDAISGTNTVNIIKMETFWQFSKFKYSRKK